MENDFFSVKSISINKCAQVFTNIIVFTRVYPKNVKSKAHVSFTSFIHEVGILHELNGDNSKEVSSGEFRRKLYTYEAHFTASEYHSPWQKEYQRKIKSLNFSQEV